MLKKRNRGLESRIGYAVLWGGVVIFLTSLPSGGQTSATVNSNVDESSVLSNRKPSAVTQPPLLPVPEGFANLKLSPGYLLEMDVFGAPEMSMQVRIDGAGNVTLPLIGSIRLTGDTVVQAQSAIAKAYEDQEILKNPQVTLNILEFAAQNISVLGEVQSPGRIQLLAPEPLGDVLALAGGESIAAGNDIEIQHPSGHGELLSRHVHYVQGKESAVLQREYVEPGDTVLVHRAGIIYVLGAVNRPGGYLMINGGTLNVIQAISLAGGTGLQAATKWAVIVRRQGDGFVQLKVPLSKMEKGGANPIPLEINDALYVPLSGWKAVLENSSSVLSAVASAAVYRAP